LPPRAFRRRLRGRHANAGGAERRFGGLQILGSRGATTRPIKTERLSKSTTDPKAVSAAARICTSESSAAWSKAGTAPIRRCPTNSIKSRRRAPSPSRDARKVRVDILARQAFQRPPRLLTQFLVSGDGDLQQRRYAGHIPQSLDDSQRREPRRLGAALGRLQHRGQRPGVAAIGQDEHEQSLPLGRRLVNSATIASVVSVPASSRAVPKPSLNSAGSGDFSCSIRSGMPADCRARIAPRVASSTRGLGTSALRTRRTT